VLDSPEARKTHALNLIHQVGGTAIILLFDADTRPGPGIVARMREALADPEGPGVVAVRYVGSVPPVDPAQGRIAEWCRVLVSNAINHFDECYPRADGKAMGYRRDLIDHHPGVLAMDVWLEGVAWERSRGCRYLSDVAVGYRFPGTWGELVAQYGRYEWCLRDLTERAPGLVRRIAECRRSVRSGRARWLDRALGRWFFAWVRRYGSAVPNGDAEAERWQRIESTKFPIR
jgi:hypothetical protein